MTDSTVTSLGAAAEGDWPEPPWLRAVARELGAGRHVVLHGAVRDLSEWDDGYRDQRFILSRALPAMGFDVVGFHDPVDGMRFPVDGMEALCAGLAEPRGTGGRGRLPDVRQPLAAMGVIRAAVQQSEVACAFVLDFADIVLRDPGASAGADRELIVWLKTALHDARFAGLRGLRNSIVLVAEDLDQVPQGLYLHDPRVTTVQVDVPSLSERRAFLDRAVPLFHGAEALAEPDRGVVVDTLANLSDGLGLFELDALRRLSLREGLPVDQPRPLMNLYRYGEQVDRWEQLDDARIATAEEVLGRRVIGQERAVAAVADRLAAARSGLDLSPHPDVADTQPKGQLFLVGPTGVGKNELAKALAELVFDDESALASFDMGEYKEEHSGARLIGAPPGYVGHEQGGQLTNRLRTRPASLLLFDEFEKAHPAVYDKFLPILQDGRLTDGQGSTVYFGQTFIVFTSNVGADELHRAIRRRGQAPDYEEVRAIFESAVEDYFTRELGRPELLGRLGDGVVVFDVLRDDSIEAITRKFLAQLAASARLRRDLDLRFDEAGIFDLVRRDLYEAGGLAFGGRRIRTVIDTTVRLPLVRAIRDAGVSEGSTVTAWVPPGAVEAVIEMTSGSARR